MSDFFTKNRSVLQNYVRLSNSPGSRADYVQGGGGNTSCKFDDKLMAIKASGYKLNQIKENDAYAVLDYASIVDFYKNTDPHNLEDVEKEGSLVAKKSIVEIEGLPVLRPSVEAGFHSILAKYVLHTHPVYANLVTCSAQGRQIAKEVLSDRDYSFGFVPYINPGASLTFEIFNEQQRVLKETGRLPCAIFMQNHGFIATNDDLEKCLEIHEEVNALIAEKFNVSASDFPEISLMETDGYLISNTVWLKEKIKDSRYDENYFCVDALYPDQLVFLSGNMEIIDDVLLENFDVRDKSKCTVFRKSGDIVYNCTKSEAMTIEETLAAVIFITSTIESCGYNVITMSESGKDFIANWEGEKYRKSIAQKS